MLDLMPPEWSTAVPDWKARIGARRSLMPALPLDLARADKAERIFRQLRAPDITGFPTYGECCDAWVFELVRAVFGAVDAVTRQRAIREYFVLVPKKNMKTGIAAALIVVAAILNEHPDAELLLIAPTIQIAERAFKQCAGIIRLTVMRSGQALADLFHARAHERRIQKLDLAMPSEIVVKAADTEVVTGSKARYVLIDETHEFASKPKAADVFVELRGGVNVAGNLGWLLQISTQSKAPPAGVFKDELKIARMVRDGELRLPLLPLIYELPPEIAAGDGWKDPATWPLVNPHLNRGISAAALAADLAAAEEKGVAALALFASQHLNVEIGQSLYGEAWAGAAHWQARALPGGLTLEALLAEAEVCTIGADWGGANDLASLVVLGRSRRDKAWLVWHRSWARESVFRQNPQIEPRCRGYVADGDLEIADTPEAQAAAAAAVCARVKASGLLPETGGIGLDSAAVALLLDALEAEGCEQPLVQAVTQGWKLTQAVSTVALKLESGQLRHGGQPIMAWAVGNAKQERRGNNWLVTKQVAGSAKIDPVMALFNAAMLMFLNPVAGNGLTIRIPDSYEVA